MGSTQSIQSSSSSSTNSRAQELVTTQPVIYTANSQYSTDNLRVYNRVYQLGAEKSRRVVAYYLSQARLNGKSEFIKTLYASCIAKCIPPGYHSPELDQMWMYRILAGIQLEFPDCKADVISSSPEYITIRFRI